MSMITDESLGSIGPRFWPLNVSVLIVSLKCSCSYLEVGDVNIQSCVAAQPGSLSLLRRLAPVSSSPSPRVAAVRPTANSSTIALVVHPLFPSPSPHADFDCPTGVVRRPDTFTAPGLPGASLADAPAQRVAPSHPPAGLAPTEDPAGFLLINYSHQQLLLHGISV